MSNTPYPDDAASFSQAESSEEEELAHKLSDEDCEVCRRLRLPEPWHICTTYAMLQRAAADGCKLCEVLQRVSETACSDADRLCQDLDPIEVRPSGYDDDGCDAPLMSVDWNSVESGMGSCTVRFYVTAVDNSPWPFMISSHAPIENASIRDYAVMVRDMLDDCETTHTTCEPNNVRHNSSDFEMSKLIPKRLLHISSDRSPFQVRLWETGNEESSLKGAGLQYTALSHCWGSTPITKTTTATISKFKTEGISWTSLPKTFQEAISLTYELGIHYIWIDSLCIIQDSLSDWAEQASQMADIFSNAHLTIAANASQNGQQGLLNRHHKARYFETTHDGTAFSVCIRDSVHHEFVHNILGTLSGHSDLPLRKRAWCFQEELLSTRVIHFTGDEIQFVCRAATICECYPEWQDRFESPFTEDGTGFPALDWGHFIKHYTARQITFPGDRLPALSSFTHAFQEGPDRYHAGLWESHMPGSLLWWSQCGKRPEQERNSQSRPPSWSWASIEGQANYSEATSTQDIAEVLDVCTYSCTTDPRGVVSGGQITLRAPLFSLRGMWKNDKNPWEDFLRLASGDSSFDPCFSCSPDWATDRQWLEEDGCYCVLDDSAHPLLLPENSGINTPIFLLIIHRLEQDVWWAKKLPYPGGYRFLGLLLQPLEDLSQTQMKAMEDSESKLSFVRIGFGGICLSKEDGEEALNRFGNTTITIF